MGDIYARVKINGPLGEVEVEALVDTGATFTKISTKDAEKVGLVTKRDTIVQLADGSLVTRRMGFAEAEVEGIRGIIPITVAPESGLPLLGYTALEIMELKPNPSTRALEHSGPIEYQEGNSFQVPAKP